MIRREEHNYDINGKYAIKHKVHHLPRGHLTILIAFMKSDVQRRHSTSNHQCQCNYHFPGVFYTILWIAEVCLLILSLLHPFFIF